MVFLSGMESPVRAEISVRGERAQIEEGFSSGQSPSRASEVEPVGYQVAGGALSLRSVTGGHLDVAQAIADRQRQMTGRAVRNFGVAACAVTTRPPSAAAAAASSGFAAR